MRAGFFYSVFVRFRSFFGRFSVIFGTFSVVFCTLFRASLVAKEAFVNAFGLPRLAFGICLTARAAQLCVRQHVAVVAKGAKVVCIKHEPLLLPRGRALFDWAHMMYLSGSRRASLSLTTLAQWVSREGHAPQLQPVARVDHSLVVFIFSHSLLLLFNPPSWVTHGWRCVRRCAHRRGHALKGGSDVVLIIVSGGSSLSLSDHTRIYTQKYDAHLARRTKAISFAYALQLSE